jgi:thiol-disulfide isomerase/thioredoxin
MMRDFVSPVLACSSLVLVSFLGILNAAPNKNPVGLTLRDLGGQRVRLQDYRGHIVVLNFWATWCAPCTQEMPLLARTAEQYRSRGVTFVGASLDDSKTAKNVPGFVNKYQVAFPVWVGATGDNLDRFGLGDAVPATAFIDQDGHIVARVLGEIRKEELVDRLEWLLGDRKSPAPPAIVKRFGGK